MRKIGLMALLAVAALGFARQSSAAQINLTFTSTDGTFTQYVVEAVGDVNWTGVNFGVDTSNTHTFNANTTNFALTGSFTSGTTKAYNLDQGVIGPCPGSGCFASGATISVGTFLGTLAGGSPGLFGPTNLDAGGAGGILDASPPYAQNGLDSGGSPIPVFVTVNNVPEPTTIVLLGAGLAGLAFLRRRTA